MIPISDDLIRLRFHYIQILTSASIVLGIVGLAAVLLESGASGVLNIWALVTIVFFIVLNGIWLILTHLRYQQIAANGLLITLVLGAAASPNSYSYLLVASLAIVTAATLADRRVFLAANLIVLGAEGVTILRLLLDHPGTIPPQLYSNTMALIALTFISLATRYFINAAQAAVSHSRSTADLLQSTSDVGQSLSQILDLDELLERAVNLIRTRFKYYHVQIFLVNDMRDQAVLAASTGEIGKRLLAHGHQLSVGSQSVIGQVVLRGTSMMVSDTRRESVHYRNELLPNTRSELALPLREGTTTIGALDIQSVNRGAFAQSDVQALQIMSDLLATAIRNARLFRQQNQTTEENELLLRDSQMNLREIERLNQELTRMAWQEYATEERATTGITLENNRLRPMSDWSDELARAGQEGRVISTSKDGHNMVAVPVTLRGQVIGAIEVEAGTENKPETLEMVQAVAQRLALSLENARLYEETRQTAAQEQRINDIAARFQTVATVDELLRITLTELSETLGAEHGAIRLGNFTEQNGGNHHDG